MHIACLLSMLLGGWPSHEEIAARADQERLPLVLFVGRDVEAGEWIGDHEPESILPHMRVMIWRGELRYEGIAYCIERVRKLLRP